VVSVVFGSVLIAGKTKPLPSFRFTQQQCTALPFVHKISGIFSFHHAPRDEKKIEINAPSIGLLSGKH